MCDVPSHLAKHLAPDVMRALGWTKGQLAEHVAGVDRTQDFVELFSGTGGLSTACRMRGLSVLSYDLKDDPIHENMMTAEGRAYATLAVLSVKPHGCVWVGFPCTTMVWISRSAMKRTHSTPDGDVARPDVAAANSMAAFVSVLLRVAFLREVTWIIEQPGSSVLFSLGVMKHLISSTKAGRVWAHLGAFGGDLMKPSLFYGTVPWRDLICRTMPRDKSKNMSKGKYWVRKGASVTGTKALKSSEHYPRPFCKAVAMYIHRAVQGKPCATQSVAQPSAKRTCKRPCQMHDVGFCWAIE